MNPIEEEKLRNEALLLLNNFLSTEKVEKQSVYIGLEDFFGINSRYLYNIHNLPFLGKSFGEDGKELTEEFIWSRPRIEIFIDKLPQFKYFSRSRHNEIVFYSEIIENIDVNYTEMNDELTFTGSLSQCYYDIKRVKFNGLLCLVMHDREKLMYTMELRSEGFTNINTIPKYPLSFPKAAK